MSLEIRFVTQSFALLALLTALVGTAFAEPLTFTKLTLINGWARYSTVTRAPSIAMDTNRIVRLRGAIHQTSGNEPHPFVLPPKFRPSADVFVPAGLINGRSGRLWIRKDGTVYVQAADNQSDAQGFTSLEGVTYSRN